jgi:hypothetical protein
MPEQNNGTEDSYFNNDHWAGFMGCAKTKYFLSGKYENSPAN